MKSGSLRLRLSLLVSLILAFVLVVISIVAYVELREALLFHIDPTLKAMAQGILADFDEILDDEARRADLQSISGYTGRRYSNQYRIWMDGSDVDLFVSDLPVDAEKPLVLRRPISERPEVGEFTFFTLGSEQYRAIWTRQSVKEGIVNILIAGSAHHVYHEMQEFLQLLLILGVSLLLGFLLLAPLIISWGIRPVEQVAARLRQVTHRTLGQEELDLQGVSPELRPIVEALNEMLARLNAALRRQSQFTVDASHELRTPVGLIKSTLQTARLKERGSAEYRRAIDEALEDTERMERLIEQFLVLARVEDSGRPQNTTRVALEKLLSHLAAEYASRAAQQGGQVVCRNGPAVWVRGNETELTQLFGNLLDNAIKYGPPGRGVCVTLADAGDNHVEVRIHDEGGRIPADALPRLFDRFYRIESSRARTTGGTGLGLAIAREIARRHGGDVEIASTPEVGTTVFVRLPKLPE